MARFAVGMRAGDAMGCKRDLDDSNLAGTLNLGISIVPSTNPDVVRRKNSRTPSVRACDGTNGCACVRASPARHRTIRELLYTHARTDDGPCASSVRAGQATKPTARAGQATHSKGPPLTVALNGVLQVPRFTTRVSEVVDKLCLSR